MIVMTVQMLGSIFTDEVDGSNVGVLDGCAATLVGTLVSVKNGVGGGNVPVAANVGVDGTGVATVRMSSNSPG